MACTRTGSFPIGFRRTGDDWQKDLPALINWAKANEFEVIDVGPVPPAQLQSITAAGLRIGSVNLKDQGNLVSPDAGLRRATAQANAEYIKSVAPAGAKVFFTAMVPPEKARPRHENFGFAVDGYGQLCSAIRGDGARIAIEGWAGPQAANLACTPADYRAMFKALPDNAAINFDPSHLIRMFIDPIRFLEEFAPRVAHVHGKDTEILTDELQEHGILQQATFAPSHKFGGHYWRFCIPGHGVARWGKMFRMLKEAGYNGEVCIELEDENFRGTPEGAEGDKRGLIAGRQFLAGV